MGDRQEMMRYEENTTNPAPLGLAGFGMTTLLLNLHNMGLFEMDTMIMAMGIFFGGFAQAIVGKMEWKKNNMFGMVAFSSYGFFWIILVALMILPEMGVGEAPSKLSMGWFLTIWGILSFGLWIATFKLAKMMRILFALVVLLFFFLAASDFLAAAGNSAAGTVHFIAGVIGVICGALALYLSIAMVVNDTHCKEVLPLV